MDLILIITHNQRNLGVSAHHKNNQMLNYILHKKDSTSVSPKDIMLEDSLNLTLWNKVGFNQQYNDGKQMLKSFQKLLPNIYSQLIQLWLAAFKLNANTSQEACH